VARRELLNLVRNAIGEGYTVEREIARGGAARVFLARTPEGTPVALKVLRPELAVTVAADRFLREIDFLSGIDHPHIPRLIASGENDFVIYYVMTHVPGMTLRDHLATHRQLGVDDTLRIADELLDALAYAHDRDIVHRDVKPENVVIGEAGAVLVDFGIARAVAESGLDKLTRSGFAVGTSAYMSPEQVRGATDIDHRSDLYSLGCVLFECLAGRPPFTASQESLVLRLHLEKPAPDVRRFRRKLKTPVARLIKRSLETDRDDRWRSAQEMQAAVRELR